MAVFFMEKELPFALNETVTILIKYIEKW